MTLRHIAWVNVLSAIGITVFIPVCVHALGVEAWLYALIPIVWVAELWLVPFLLKVDRINRGTSDA